MFEYNGNYGYNNSKEMHVEIKYKRGNRKHIYIYMGCIIAGCGKLNLHRALSWSILFNDN